MPAGGCFCDKVRLNFTGEPEARLLCHCADCKKISGSHYSDNIIVKKDNFKLEGSPKEISKTADSGKTITSYFCGDCGTTLFRDGDNFPGANIIKAGVLDDIKWVDAHPPTAELFAPERCAFVQRVPGSGEKQTME